MAGDPFSARTTLDVGGRAYTVYRLGTLEESGVGSVSTLPYSIRVLLESCLRNCDGFVVTEEHVRALASYDATNVGEQEIAFKPGRVVLQDFTGVPAVVDFAALRSPDGALAGRYRQGQSADSRRLGHRSLGTDRCLWHRRRDGAQRHPRVRAQYRAVSLLEVGPAGVRQLHRGAASHGNRAPGQPRIPRGVRARGRPMDGQAVSCFPTRWWAPIRTPP